MSKKHYYNYTYLYIDTTMEIVIVNKHFRSYKDERFYKMLGKLQERFFK